MVVAWYRAVATSARSHDHNKSYALFNPSYQQRAGVPRAHGLVSTSSDRDSRSARSQVDRSEVRPHICAPAHASVTVLFHPPPPTHPTPSIKRASQSQRLGLPLLPSPRCSLSPCPSCPFQLAPQHLTLPSSCGQLQASTSSRRMRPVVLGVLLSTLLRSLDVSAAVLGSFLPTT